MGETSDLKSAHSPNNLQPPMTGISNDVGGRVEHLRNMRKSPQL